MYKAPDEGEAFGAWKDEAVDAGMKRRQSSTFVTHMPIMYR